MFTKAEQANEKKDDPKLEEEKNEIVEKQIRSTVKELRQEFIKSMENAPILIVDCSFQDLLTRKELNSLCSQIGYCHNANKKQPFDCKMTLTSYRDRVKDKLNK